MARKGSQQRNGVDRNPSNLKKKVSDPGHARSNAKGKGKTSEMKVFPGDQLLNAGRQCNASSDYVSSTYHTGDENKVERDSIELEKNESPEAEELQVRKGYLPSGDNVIGGRSAAMEKPIMRDENGSSSGNESDIRNAGSGSSSWLDDFSMKKMMESIGLSSNLTITNLKTLVMHMMSEAGEWLERQRPLFIKLTTNVYNARDYMKLKMEKAYPIIWRWVIHFANIFLLLSMVWLDSTLRGIDSFLRLGTTSFFSALWCSILSIIAMAGISKFLIALAITAFVGVFIGFTLGLFVLAICGTIFLWVYGSFWMTAFVILIGGLAFMSRHERVALLIANIYSIYCAWMYVGWLGLLMAFNLSFISSDILVYFVKNNMSRQRRSDGTPEQFVDREGQPGVSSGESSETAAGLSQDRSPGIPSTNGVDADLTSEDEIIRLLNCSDHYSAVGLPCYENIDASVLKKEYRKKAMLVHPDKNMGNEKAAEAFKKLQNAYEVLLDSAKRKAYDDELRAEELLNYLRRFQNTSPKNGDDGFFAQANGEDPFIDARRIACKKCGTFHVWLQTKKTKSQARWCQDCKDFHQAKDGDGWVEQSSHPIFFGLLQKVDTPCAYVCADGKVYNATEWYICQGMRCPANTHKPSFHVNTSMISNKQNPRKGTSSGQKSGKMPNMEETMTEEEFVEWLQNAMQAGVFDNFSGASAAGGKGSGGSNAGVGGGSGGGSNKRKKKGKK